MDIKLSLDYLDNLENTNIKVDVIKFQKMLFFYNSIEQGWSIKKSNNSYILKKSHEGKKEILEDAFLSKFMKANLDLNKFLS